MLGATTVSCFSATKEKTTMGLLYTHKRTEVINRIVSFYYNIEIWRATTAIRVLWRLPGLSGIILRSKREHQFSSKRHITIENKSTEKPHLSELSLDHENIPNSFLDADANIEP
jgi:hypothetical protein